MVRKTYALAAVLVTGVGGAASAGLVTYVDADPATNTTLADGTALPTTGDDVAGDNTWRLRAFGNGASILESNGNAGGEDAPMMRTRISGLTPGETYTVFGYFWNGQSTWRARAAVSDTQPAPEIQGYNTNHFDGSSFLPMDGPLADGPVVGFGQASLGVALDGGSTGDVATNDADWTSADYFDAPVLIGEGNRSLTQATLGDFVANAGGEIDVYIDDLANTAQDNRTWYDGVGYTLVPEPGSLALLAVGGLAFARRRRRMS